MNGCLSEQCWTHLCSHYLSKHPSSQDYNTQALSSMGNLPAKGHWTTGHSGNSKWRKATLFLICFRFPPSPTPSQYPSFTDWTLQNYLFNSQHRQGTVLGITVDFRHSKMKVTWQVGRIQKSAKYILKKSLPSWSFPSITIPRWQGYFDRHIVVRQ